MGPILVPLNASLYRFRETNEGAGSLRIQTQLSYIPSIMIA
nr:hypothetical protein [uncultured bacterium]